MIKGLNYIGIEQPNTQKTNLKKNKKAKFNFAQKPDSFTYANNFSKKKSNKIAAGIGILAMAGAAFAILKGKSGSNFTKVEASKIQQEAQMALSQAQKMQQEAQVALAEAQKIQQSQAVLSTAEKIQEEAQMALNESSKVWQEGQEALSIAQKVRQEARNEYEEIYLLLQRGKNGDYADVMDAEGNVTARFKNRYVKKAMEEIENGAVVRRTEFRGLTLDITAIYKNPKQTADGGEKADSLTTFAKGKIDQYFKDYVMQADGAEKADAAIFFQDGRPSEYKQGFETTVNKIEKAKNTFVFNNGDISSSQDATMRLDRDMASAKRTFDFQNGKLFEYTEGYEIKDGQDTAKKALMFADGKLTKYVTNFT